MPVVFILFYLLFTSLLCGVEYYFNRLVGKLFVPIHWAARLCFCTSLTAGLSWIMATVLFFCMRHWFVQSFVSTLLIVVSWNLVCKLLFVLLAIPMRFLSSRASMKLVFSGASLVVFLLGVYGLKGVYNAHHPVVKPVEVRFSSLPECFDGYKIVFLSDIHYGVFGSYSDLMVRTRAAIEKIQPDLLVVGGDWVSTTSEELVPIFSILKKMDIPDGKLAVMGNHDYMTYRRNISLEERRRDSLALKILVRAMRFKWLDDLHTVVRRGGDSIVVAGVENWGEARFGQKGNIDKALAGVSDSAFVVLASHNPEHFRRVVRGNYPVDLTLSGHTHAMQCVVAINGRRYSAASLLYPLWGGLYDFGDQKLFVSEGLGSSLYAFRIGTQAEIAVITLRKQR